VWLGDALWRRLEVEEALGRVLGPRRFSTDVERVLFAMVANRALDPCSKLACSEWATEDVAIGGLEEIEARAGGGVLRPAVLRHHEHLLRA
jgi:hypothetical protein